MSASARFPFLLNNLRDSVHLRTSNIPYLLATMELMNLCLSFLSFYPCLYPILRAPLCVDYRPFLCPLGEVRYRA